MDTKKSVGSTMLPTDFLKWAQTFRIVDRDTTS